MPIRQWARRLADGLLHPLIALHERPLCAYQEYPLGNYLLGFVISLHTDWSYADTLSIEG